VINNPSFGKILLLDGDIQLATKDETVYHELLVHPAIIAHPNPRRVLILGGGDGGSLREVARHTAIERIVLVDIDPDVIAECTKSLPEVADGAFEDSRLELVIQDANLYLRNYRGHPFDVVIVDLTAVNVSSTKVYASLGDLLSRVVSATAFITMHSGWWGLTGIADYPRELFRSFPRVLLHNEWIGSFACFWSFVLTWKHGVTEREVLARIFNQSELGTEHFRPKEYAQQAFVRSSLES
jgi:spermidine synthase